MNARAIEAAILAAAQSDPSNAAALALALERVELARFWRAARRHMVPVAARLVRVVPKMAEELDELDGAPGEPATDAHKGACEDRWVEAQVQGAWPPLSIACPTHHVPERTPCPHNATIEAKNPPPKDPSA